MPTLIIPSRFNGPPASGNGGYACGALAALVGEGAEVTLRLPPPLNTPLEVRSEGDLTTVHDGERLIAEARIVDWDLEVPPAPDLDTAADASTRYAGFDAHEFPTCFTCGIDRDDGLSIWPGPVPGSDLVATPWAAPDDLPVVGANLAPEIVWAALDCPGAWAAARDMTVNPVVLGRMAARLLAPVPAEGDFVAYGWPLGEDGRKSYSGTAIADADGTVLAYARQTWITVRPV